MSYYVNKYVKDLYRVKFHDERENVLRLDMNENPMGLPKEVFQRIWNKITPEYIATYPQKDALMELLAEHNNVKYENISVTAGSDEAMRLIFQCFGEPGKKVLTVTPTFEMYDVYSKMFGMEHVTVDYQNDYSIRVEDILHLIDEETGLVILLNPNSPIGTAYKEDEVEIIISRAAAVNALVVVDEAYHYFYQPTFLDLINRYDNLLVLRTFSKLFSMAGLRIGYVTAHHQLIEYIEKAESTFNVNNIAILFAKEVIQDQKLQEQLISIEREGRLWLTKKLTDAGDDIISLEGNYVLFHPKHSSKELVEHLKQQNIWVRDYSRGILSGWIRVSTGAKECMEQFWNALMSLDS